MLATRIGRQLAWGTALLLAACSNDPPAASQSTTRTVYRRKSTGKSITLRITKTFATRFRNVPTERLKAAGRDVMQLPDQDIFETAP